MTNDVGYCDHECWQMMANIVIALALLLSWVGVMVYDDGY